MKRLNIIKGMAALILPCLFSCTDSTSVLVSDNQQQWGDDVTNFTLTGQVNTDCAAIAALWFHSNKPGEGYEVRFHNGPIDGTQKTGSLTDVRNLYRSLAADSTWADFEISVRQKNIEVKINKTTVVSYTEPNKPWRDENHSRQQLSHGKFRFIGYAGRTTFRNLKLTPLPDNAVNPNDTLPPVEYGIAQTAIRRRIYHQAPFQKLCQLHRQHRKDFLLGFCFGKLPVCFQHDAHPAGRLGRLFGVSLQADMCRIRQPCCAL